MLDSPIRPGVAQAQSAHGLGKAGRAIEDAYRSLIRRLGGTAWFAWLGIHVLTRADRWLFPRFHGHIVSAGPPIFPLLQLTTTGRRSGLPRRAPLIYLAEGDKLIVVASNWGQLHHPGWSANLLNDSRATVEIKGRQHAVTARLATAAEKQDLWPRLLALYAPYQAYADRSGRDLRLFVLTPACLTRAAAGRRPG
jgi:deazaflavin-dependent oxidoreductase (nitroreductase family)